MFLLIFLQKCCTVPQKTILFAKSAVLYQKNQKKSIFQVPGTSKRICLSIRQKRLVSFGTVQCFLLMFLQMCCTVQKTNHLLQKCCPVPKKTKNNLFQSCCTVLVFIGQHSIFAKRLVFLGQYSVFCLTFLQKCCTVQKIVFFGKVLYCPKKPKKPIFPVLLPCEVPGPEKVVFLVFGTVQHFSKKRLVPLDSTASLLIFLQKCCTVQKSQSSFFCKSAVLSQKNQSFGRPVVGSSLTTGKNCFFGFFGTVQHFCKKRLVVLGQYSVFC